MIKRKLQNKTALITGCNRGIGKEIMTLFAQEGANIIACSRSYNEIFNQQLEELSCTYGVQVYSINFDMGDEMSIKSGIKDVKALKIPIDIMVNNAGVPHLALVPFTRMSDVRTVFQVNYFAHLQIVQGLFNLIAKSGGCIINMASAAAFSGDAGNAVYGASKACMVLLTKVLAKEMANYGVRVNALAPGLADTEFAASMGEKAKESMKANSLFHRLGTATEIAKAALFLASDDASFITGQVLRIDGGLN